MPKDIEELKMIVDLAKSDGKKEAENEMLKTVKKQLEDTCAKQQKMLAQKDKQLAEKDKKIEEQKAQIAELKLQKKALERKLAKIKALAQ